MDYRKGEVLNLKEIKSFFEDKGYQVDKFLPQERHVCAVIQKEEVSDFLFLKLSTSKGISVVTENEAAWNMAAAGKILVPKNYDRGYFKKDYFYNITSYFQGKILDKNIVKAKIEEIIKLSETVMNLAIGDLPSDKYNNGNNYLEMFLNKVQSHFDAVPEPIAKKYQLEKLLFEVKETAPSLQLFPRHGDFAPWHMILTKDEKIALIDGEHAMAKGVEYYDIGYFIQRVYAVWREPELAKNIYDILINRGYDKKSLRTILMARTIGGFLDESLAPNPDYSLHEEMKSWLG